MLTITKIHIVILVLEASKVGREWTEKNSIRLGRTYWLVVLYDYNSRLGPLLLRWTQHVLRSRHRGERWKPGPMGSCMSVHQSNASRYEEFHPDAWTVVVNLGGFLCPLHFFRNKPNCIIASSLTSDGRIDRAMDICSLPFEWRSSSIPLRLSVSIVEVGSSVLCISFVTNQIAL